MLLEACISQTEKAVNLDYHAHMNGTPFLWAYDQSYLFWLRYIWHVPQSVFSKHAFQLSASKSVAFNLQLPCHTQQQMKMCIFLYGADTDS